MSSLSPSILATSNLIYLDNPVISWEHLIAATFMSLSNAEVSMAAYYKSLQSELVENLNRVKKEFDDNAHLYQDVLNITFESKVRFVLSIMKVSRREKKLRAFFF